LLPPPPDNPAPGLSDNFAIATRETDGVTVLGVSGSIDLSTARDLHAELQRHVDEPVIVDLCACDFVDSTSIGVLLRRYRSAPALTRVVTAPGSTVAATLTITLHLLMPLDSTVELAVRALASAPSAAPTHPAR
jgi:anti-anti-sigma factor